MIIMTTEIKTYFKFIKLQAFILFDVQHGGTYPSLRVFCQTCALLPSPLLPAALRIPYFHLPFLYHFFPLFLVEFNDIFLFTTPPLSNHFSPYDFIISIIASSEFLLSLTSLFMCSFLILVHFSCEVFISLIYLFVSLSLSITFTPNNKLFMQSLIWNLYQNFQAH